MRTKPWESPREKIPHEKAARIMTLKYGEGWCVLTTLLRLGFLMQLGLFIYTLYTLIKCIYNYIHLYIYNIQLYIKYIYNYIHLILGK